MSEILIRFNTNGTEDDPLKWRVFVDGEEHLASDFEVIGRMTGKKSDENGVAKYNIGCTGSITWENTVARIKTQ
jgi:hypothetical protein